MKRFLTLFALCSLSVFALQAQDATPLIKRYLMDQHQKLHLSKEDASNGWVLSDQYLTRHNQVTQAYVQQTINGLKLYNAISSVAIKDGTVAVFNSRFVPNAAHMVNATPGMQQITPRQATLEAAKNVQVTLVDLQGGDDLIATDKPFILTAGGTIQDPIKATLLYVKTAEEIRLAWNIEMHAKSDWWHVRVDALTGEILDKGNYTVYCNFDHDAYDHLHQTHAHEPRLAEKIEEVPGLASAAYRVFPFPVESPSHGSHTLVSDPSSPVGSPYGWHDTDGAPGAEYTITRGNNVLASEDRDDNDDPGYSPDGGANLLFDFPYNANQDPLAWQDAAITNLFYANNIMHDLTYHFGFDEVSGNYQENNYGNGGEGDDAVQADAQDGSGTDNANFQAPPDGISGRMQMYIWTDNSTTSDSLRVNSPAAIAGVYFSPLASFGPVVNAPITADVVIIEDDTAPTSNGCETIVNGAALVGKIALIDRGNCGFPIKVQAAQDAGAIAVIVVNNSTANPSSMPGSSGSITIPSVMISQANGNAFKAQLANGPVNVTFLPSEGRHDRDSDVDNGIIAHEYGHGISIRLTGGPSTSSCLNNAEQMGEGWSDFYALTTTILPTDTRFTDRPVGTYALGDPVNGNGIRNQLYSTDMSVNTYTYADVAGTQGEVHNIGEIWTTMLWDLTWDLIDQYGFNPDPTVATAGNNIAQQLVMDGYKLQPCSPGFVDGRDAILQADQLNYGGANRCLIWKAFARRGLGFSADQGDSNVYDDGKEAFDIPTFCQVAVEAPVAGFTVDRTSSCLELATFKFTDQSQNIAQQWLWEFGDGTTSTEINPSHTYTTPGTYTVTLTVTNNISSNSLVKANYITVVVLPAPAVTGATICNGQSATLTASPSVSGNVMEWSDVNGDAVFTGSPFTTPVLNSNTTYSVREIEDQPVQKVGPVNFGSGGNHATSFIGKVLFTAEKAFVIKTVKVRAQGAGPREVRLYDANGDVLKTVTVNIPDGDSRITLNIKVPDAGDYSLGAGPNVNLFRNNAGTTFPFTIAGLVSITGSNSGQPGFYYYFYDWEVQEAPCRSLPGEVVVAVQAGPLANFSSTMIGLTATFSDLSVGNPTTWSWNFGDGNTSNLPSPSHTYAAKGVYTVELTVSNGTCSHVITRVLDFTVGLPVLNPDNFNVELSPNPAAETVYLTLVGAPGSRQVQVGLYSADGRLVQSRSYDIAQGSVIRYDLNGVAAGLYLVRVEAAAGLVMKKLVVD